MRELTTYTLALYAGLNLISLASIFLFDYYEQALGGPWANAGLGAMLGVPIVIAMGFGYAISAYVRDRKRPPVNRPYWVAATGAAISMVLVFGTPLLELLTPSAWFGIGVLAAYFVVVGLVTPWITALLRRNLASAA